jgi:heat shock protein HtpX
MAIAKRLALFFVTNLGVLLVLSIVLSILGVGRYVSPDGRLNLTGLALFCLFWGMGGAFLSLQLSRFLAKRSVGAQLIDGRTGDPTLDWLYQTVARLAQQSNLPMPEVAFYRSAEVNAFATGPSKRRSLVAVSSGLLSGMRRNEIEAVLAHEMGHVANGDMVTMTLLQGVINAFVLFFARVVAFLARQYVGGRDGENSGLAQVVGFVVMIVFQIGLGLLGSTVVAWFSREREFHADAAAAHLAGRQNMIAALRRLMGTEELVDTSNATLAAFKIAGGHRGWLSLFATHPPLPVRIAALEAGRYQPA